MTISDRRSGTDRRTVERRNVSIDVEWEDIRGRHAGTLSDLSEAGCFVLSSGEVNRGDLIRILLPLGDGMKVQIQGEVRNQVYEIGFALKFADPTEAQVDVITGLMAKHGEYVR